jgi:FKBP-type peptidyl-prolyl cis-trans isomerase SlpA
VSDLVARSGELRIGPRTRVTLHFSIFLDSGEEVDTSRRGKPGRFCVGDGNLLPGFEQALLGLKAGDDEQLIIKNGFGERVDDNVRLLSTDAFKDPLEVGLVVSFASPEGELSGVVRKLGQKRVEVDFNHPLAGRALLFDVSILHVEPV